jgi:predicted nucleic acid-binding protein
MFGRAELLGVLRQVAGDVMVPATVFAECTRDTTKPGVSGLVDAAASGGIEMVADPDLGSGRFMIASLDAGEIMALALARQLGCPVLMDEALGRKAAAKHGIPVIGGAGILLAAKKRGFIAEIGPILNGWKSWGYFLSPALVDAVLTRAGERL